MSQSIKTPDVSSETEPTERARLDAYAAVVNWCDEEEKRTTEWLEQHNPDCECEVGVTILSCIKDVRQVIKEATVPREPVFSPDAEEEQRLRQETLHAAETLAAGGEVGSAPVVVANLLAMYERDVRLVPNTTATEA